MASFLFSALAGVLAFDFFSPDDSEADPAAGRIDDLPDNSDTIEGSMLDDIIHGDASGQTIVALGGNDAIVTYEGDDVVYANDGDDTVSAGWGDDMVWGGDGELWGGAEKIPSAGLTAMTRSAATIASKQVPAMTPSLPATVTMSFTQVRATILCGLEVEMTRLPPTRDRIGSRQEAATIVFG